MTGSSLGASAQVFYLRACRRTLRTDRGRGQRETLLRHSLHQSGARLIVGAPGHRNPEEVADRIDRARQNPVDEVNGIAAK
jgi:hypothetical protein